jgi:hypothetical protein
VKREPLTVCKWLLLVTSILVLASCAGGERAESREREVPGSHSGKDDVVLYQRDSDSVSVSPRSRSLVLQHQW